MPVTDSSTAGRSPGRAGGPAEERAAVTLTHPEDEVKAEEQVFDALGASFDRHGEGWTGLSCTEVGRRRAGWDSGAGGCGLASGLHF